MKRFCVVRDVGELLNGQRSVWCVQLLESASFPPNFCCLIRFHRLLT